jgi:type IV pilus assembly protein PilA
MEFKGKDEKGFTLIELLVVVAIIGILAAIAIPQFSAYRNQGFNARSSSDLRNLATAQEAYFAQQATYQTDPTTLPGFRQSPGVTVTVVDNGDGTFVATAVHASTGDTYTWNSGNGGLQ